MAWVCANILFPLLAVHNYEAKLLPMCKALFSDVAPNVNEDHEDWEHLILDKV